MAVADSEYQKLKDSIFKIENKSDFKRTVLEVFYFQYRQIPLYHAWVESLGINPKLITEVEQIPFLPIRFFKEHRVLRTNMELEKVFSSSGTTGMERSQHLLGDLSLYQKSYRGAFEYFYGPISDYVILALLPSYLEREGSSLIYMVEDLIKISSHIESGFYLNEQKELIQMLESLKKEQKKVLLLPSTFDMLLI